MKVFSKVGAFIVGGLMVLGAEVYAMLQPCKNCSPVFPGDTTVTYSQMKAMATSSWSGVWIGILFVLGFGIMLYHLSYKNIEVSKT